MFFFKFSIQKKEKNRAINIHYTQTQASHDNKKKEPKDQKKKSNNTQWENNLEPKQATKESPILLCGEGDICQTNKIKMFSFIIIIQKLEYQKKKSK